MSTVKGTISWFRAQTLLGKRAEKKIACNTTLRRDGDVFVIKYHNTDIITICMDGRWILRTNGWTTNTTKKRLNDWTPARVYQKNFDWFLYEDENHTFDFFEGLQVNECGRIVRT